MVSLPLCGPVCTAPVKHCSVLERGRWESLWPALAVNARFCPSTGRQCSANAPSPLSPLKVKVYLKLAPPSGDWPFSCYLATSAQSPSGKHCACVISVPSEPLGQAPRLRHPGLRPRPAQVPGSCHQPTLGSLPGRGGQDPSLCQNVLVSGHFLEGAPLHRILEMSLQRCYSPFSWKVKFKWRN